MEPLREVHEPSLADRIFATIAAEILDGTLPPGARLPAERQLAEAHGVNRHVVREAIKRVEQIGLVETRQGGGTRVLDFERTAGLDALALLAEHAKGDLAGARLWRAGLEMRAAIGTDLARLCALRADNQTKRDLVELAHKMQAAEPGPALVALDLAFWERMLDGAQNVAYRLAYNSLIRSAQADLARQVAWTVEELSGSAYRLPIAEAIAAGDSAAAEAATRTSLRGAIALIDRAIDELESANPQHERA